MKNTEYLSGTLWNLRDLVTFSTQKSEHAHFDQRRSHLTLLRARNCMDRPKILLDWIYMFKIWERSVKRLLRNRHFIASLCLYELSSNILEKSVMAEIYVILDAWNIKVSSKTNIFHHPTHLWNRNHTKLRKLSKKI